MRTQITLLREQLARHLQTRGADDPQVEHLRWQIASLERQDRWREHFRVLIRAIEPLAGLERMRAGSS